MTTREAILKLARKGPLRATKLASRLGVSRQTVTSHLRRLVQAGKLVRMGHTRGAVYRKPTRTDRTSRASSVTLVKNTKGLAEDRVLAEIALRLFLKKRMNTNVYSIFSYAITEMINNVIEHSRSKKVKITVHVDLRSVQFEVRDTGVGIFQNVREKFRLADEFGALEHVLKGKQTTAPEAHSGEGIFFTSRIADKFSIRSHWLKVTIDNNVGDTFVAQENRIRGTMVTFSILARSKKRLDELFHQYTSEDYEFDKNVVRLKITAGAGALSRSQAKRLLFGMDKFRRIVFDFSGIKEIGQGFADEIFRVYAKCHPETLIEYSNACDPVAFMVHRARRSPAIK